LTPFANKVDISIEQFHAIIEKDFVQIRKWLPTIKVLKLLLYDWEFSDRVYDHLALCKQLEEIHIDDLHRDSKHIQKVKRAVKGVRVFWKEKEIHARQDCCANNCCAVM